MSDITIAAHDPSAREDAGTSPYEWGGIHDAPLEWRAPSIRRDQHASAPITFARRRQTRRSHQVAFWTMSAL